MFARDIDTCGESVWVDGLGMNLSCFCASSFEILLVAYVNGKLMLRVIINIQFRLTFLLASIMRFAALSLRYYVKQRCYKQW